MLNRLKQRFVIVSGLALGLMLAGCGGGGNGGGVVGGDNTDPDDGSTVSSDPAVCGNYTPQVTVTSVTPNRGAIGVETTITIKGSGFRKCSPSVPGVILSSTGAATVVSYSNTEIVARVPAAPTARTSHVKVSVKNPSGYNAQNPPTYLGTNGSNEPTDADLFTYE